MKKLLFIFLLMLSTNALAQTREWTLDEKLWGATAGILLVGDWATTYNMTHRYNKNYYEHNPVLGPRPTTSQVNLYFLIATPTIYLLADQVPAYRTQILQATSAIELIMVGNNLRIGLHFQF